MNRALPGYCLIRDKGSGLYFIDVSGVPTAVATHEQAQPYLKKQVRLMDMDLGTVEIFRVTPPKSLLPRTYRYKPGSKKAKIIAQKAAWDARLPHCRTCTGTISGGPVYHGGFPYHAGCGPQPWRCPGCNKIVTVKDYWCPACEICQL